MIGAELSILMQPLMTSVASAKPPDTGLTLRGHQFGIKRSIDRPTVTELPLLASLAGMRTEESDMTSLAAWMAD